MKYIILLLSVYLACSFQDHIYGQAWTARKSAPTCYTQSNADVVIGNKWYVGLGTDYCDDWYEYDPLYDKYTAKTPPPDTASGDPAAFSIGKYGYILCDNNAFWRYDPANDQWTKRADFPGGKRSAASWFVINGFAYVGSGESRTAPGTFQTDFWRYDAINDLWSRVADIPEGNTGSDGFSAHGKGYVAFGGHSTKSNKMYSHHIFEYDPISDKWTQKKSALDGRFAASVFVINNYVYIGMGIVSDTVGAVLVDSPSYHLYEYEPVAETWTPMPDMPNKCIFDEGVGFTMNNKGYMGFGDVNPSVTGCASSSDPDILAGKYKKLFEFIPPNHPPNNIERITTTPSVINIFPNPASGQVTINYTLVDKEETVIYLTDITGRKLDVIVDKVSGKGNYSITRQLSYAPGLYYMVMKQKGSVAVQKLVIE